MGDLPNHVLADGDAFEVVALRPCPPDSSAVLVEVGIDLFQVDGEPVSKASSSWNNKNTLPLAAPLLLTAVGDLETIVVTNDPFLHKVLTLLNVEPAEEGNNGDGLPNKPVAGLHIPQQEGLQLHLLENGGLVLDICRTP
jgi:hypothetical protein